MALTHNELAAWIDDEGGPYGFLRHGITPHDIPDDLRAEWSLLEQAFELFQRRWEAVSEKIGY